MFAVRLYQTVSIYQLKMDKKIKWIRFKQKNITCDSINACIKGVDEQCLKFINQMYSLSLKWKVDETLFMYFRNRNSGWNKYKDSSTLNDELEKTISIFSETE